MLKLILQVQENLETNFGYCYGGKRAVAMGGEETIKK